jgi:uncharacterized protein (TIGR03382 family)
MEPVDRQPEARIALLLVIGVLGACRNEAPLVGSAVAPLAAAQASTTGPSYVDITWMSISNIYYQTGPLNILTDGYFTRIPQSEFFGGGGGLAHTHDALKPDVPAVLQVRDALGGASAFNLLLTGHSHFDHAFDTATWASSTGAPIYGSKTTCYQLVAQNIPAAQCTSIDGGERITLSDGVTMRVVRWNHSGDSSTNPEQHDPVELAGPPTLDPITGGLYAGVADAFPNGGGARGFLFTIDGPQGRISWFFQNSASATDLTAAIIVDGVSFGAPLDNLKAAMSDAGLTSVDLWIGTGGKPVAQLVVPVLNPKAYLPVHWDDMFGAFLAGVPAAFSDPSLEAFLSQSGVNLVRPHQYMDKWRLDVSGIVAIDNGPVKQALGFCKPLTSCGTGKNCGTIPSGCGGAVSCGAGCTAPQTCGGGGTANVCGCTPVTSCRTGKNCGTIADGCGGAVSCGAGCTAPQTCGGGGSANVCGCTPVTSCGTGKNCGMIPDGCGGAVSCGAGCTAPETCGGGGTANVCGCTPVTSCGTGKNCGTIADGCGGAVSCGADCVAPETCGGGGSANVCGCTPVTSCGTGKSCGTIPDECGGTVSCGADCIAPETCGGGGSANVCGCTPVACQAGSCGSVDDGCGGRQECVCPANASCIQAHCVSIPDAGADSDEAAAEGGIPGTGGGGGAGVAGGAGAAGGAGGVAGGAGAPPEIDTASGASTDDALDDTNVSGAGGSGDDSGAPADRGQADGAVAAGHTSGGGCGCSASGSGGPTPLLLVAVLGLIARRARRR